MCTLAAKKINNKFFIFKNRDLGWNAKTRIIKENKKVKKLLVVDERGHCEGLNEYGIGLIEATLQPYPRIRYKTPSQIARRVLDQSNINDAIKIIENNKISANIIISDGKVAFIVEKTPYEFALIKIKTEGAITNLSLKLNHKNGAKLASLRESAKLRYERAKKIIKKIRKFSDIQKFLSDKEGWPANSICRGYPWWIPTRCSFIYDLKNKTIFFCKTRPDKGKFKKYQL
ncbi:MAG: carcinine hydrolase/isopenicillin-N N-acyltransferase family protein [Candidatus Paceibacterota bacterium]|jgi:hypothetical protein